MDPVVNLTPTCSLKGKVVKTVQSKLSKEIIGNKQRDVYTFRGIPYAQPPIGGLRFRDPQPISLWSGLRDATEYGAVCPQHFMMFDHIEVKFPRPDLISEDCLFLNISTPTLDSNARLPVIFWIHGGGFTEGYGHMVEGEDISNFYDVVVVTINYRLGAFGFLCTGDSASPGNYGLMDQIEALRFVQQHIAKFGGDPENVTLNGISAGSMSITLLMSTPLARGLFKRAICESGTCLSPGFVPTPAAAAAVLHFGLKMVPGCPEDLSDGTKIMEFIRGLPTDVLLKVGMFCKPVQESPLLPGGLAAVTAGDIETPCELLIGCNAHEGLMMFNSIGHIAQIAGLPTSDVTEADLRTFAVRFFSVLIGPEAAGPLADAAAKEYAVDGDDTSGDKFHEAVVELLGDFMFIANTVQFSGVTSGQNKTFLYQFCHRPSFLTLPHWALSDHASEFFYVTGKLLVENFPTSVSADDVRMSRIMLDYWMNFAKTGDPNGGDLPKWPQYVGSSKEHLELKLTPEVSAHLKQDRVEFWMKLLTKP